MDEGEEADVEAIEAGRETPKVFELVEAAFEAISQPVEVAVVFSEALARTV